MRGEIIGPRPAGGALALAIVAAVLLPPLGIFLDRGIGPTFWIGVVLTLIGFLPGLLFALYTILLAPRTALA